MSIKVINHGLSKDKVTNYPYPYNCAKFDCFKKGDNLQLYVVEPIIFNSENKKYIVPLCEEHSKLKTFEIQANYLDMKDLDFNKLI